MKLEGLAIIFLIIVLPIIIVLSDYVNKKTSIIKQELVYDNRLLGSTRDAIKAFQINNINNSYSDVATSKVDDVEAAANSFFTALASNFGYTGYRAEVMKEYVPAVVFTLYDGYYTYSRFKNTLTSTQDAPLISDPSNPDINVDEEYENNRFRYGLKPYVYYSCQYKYTLSGRIYDYIITYTLDNYITVQGIVDNNYVNKSGYLINGIIENANTYTYNGITFTESSNIEELKEYIGNDNILYSYVKINGVKYYLEPGTGYPDPTTAEIFFIDKDGEKNYSPSNTSDRDKVAKMYNSIVNNKSAYEYYKDAWEFTNWVNTNLSGLTTTSAILKDQSGNVMSNNEIKDNKHIFGTAINYEDESSDFNEHRRKIIRYIIESNLSASISTYAPENPTGSVSEYIMPRISDEDWGIIQSNVCAIGFLQGLTIGDKKYNSYSVIPNKLTKEFISEDDIYILNNNTYYKSNDENLVTSTDNNFLQNAKGYSKIDFQSRKAKESGTSNFITYFPHRESHGSYTSIVGSSGIITPKDMYDYFKNMGIYSSQFSQTINNTLKDKLKEIFYTALGRERWGAYHVNNDTDLSYFLNEY